MERRIVCAVVLLVGCGSRTALDDRAPRDASPAIDIAVPDGPDAPAPDVLADHPLVVVDGPSICGDGIVERGEACDLGAANGPTAAFELSQPGRPGTPMTPVTPVSPLARPLSVAQFYRYASASAHTGFEDVGLANFLFHVDTRTRTLGVIYLAGRDGDLGIAPAQPDSAVDLDWTGFPPGVTVAISDDADEFRGVAVGRFEGRWTFHDNTDGGGVQGLPWDRPWQITARTLRAVAIGRARFVGGGGTVPLGFPDAVVLTHRAPPVCRADCTLPRCGDATLDAGEYCDDGNNRGGDGCSADCQHFQ